MFQNKTHNKNCQHQMQFTTLRANEGTRSWRRFGPDWIGNLFALLQCKTSPHSSTIVEPTESDQPITTYPLLDSEKHRTTSFGKKHKFLL